MEEPTLAISAASLATYKMAKIFRDNKKPIVSLDFDDTGEFCVTAGSDDTISVYNCKYGKPHKTLYSKKYGIQECRFTHSNTSIIHTSTKEDDTIRYLSTHDNQYIRYFKGHKAKVVSLELSPVDDTFISGSMDGTVRLWDLKVQGSQGLATTGGTPLAAFDPHGLLFAIGTESSAVNLYDLRNFDKGPFATISGIFTPSDSWTNISFSSNGVDMLIATKNERIYILDSVECKLKHVLTGQKNPSKFSLQATFTPDGEFIVAGSEDGTVQTWDVQSGQQVVGMEGTHSGPVLTVKHNPSFNMMASACTNLAFWISVKS